jgi:hypothetical protein
LADVLVWMVIAICVRVMCPAIVDRGWAIVAIAVMVMSMSLLLLRILTLLGRSLVAGGSGILRSSGCRRVSLRLGLLLALHLLWSLTFARCIVQIYLPFVSLLEIWVVLRQDLLSFQNFANLGQVAFQRWRKFFVVFPPGGLINDSFNLFILDNDTNIRGIVGLPEDGMLVGVFHTEVFEQLHPQVFQSVRIILKQVKVVTHCNQDFIEFWLLLSVWLYILDSVNVLGHFKILIRLLLPRFVLLRTGCLDAALNDEVVLAGVVS